MYEIDFNGSNLLLRFIAFIYLIIACSLKHQFTSNHIFLIVYSPSVNKSGYIQGNSDVNLYPPSRNYTLKMTLSLCKMERLPTHLACVKTFCEKDWTEVALFRRISARRFPRTWIHWIIIFGIGWRAQCMQNERGKEASTMLTNWSRAFVKTGKRQLIWMRSTEL